MIRKFLKDLQEKDKERRAHLFFEAELVAQGQIPLDVLYGVSDNVWISLYGEKQRKTEVRVEIMYTGKRTIGVARKALENKIKVKK